MESVTTQKNYLSGAILFGLLLVVGAWLYQDHAAADTQALTAKRVEMRALYGNPKAPTTIVEFSDFECPFCSRVHTTVKQIVDESQGAVNWEYRHMPLPFHASAEEAAMVSECILRNVGVEAFWQFADTVFADQTPLSATYLAQQSSAVGLAGEDLLACAQDVAIDLVIAHDTAVAQAFGGTGTPFSLIVKPDGTVTPVRGALPYDQWHALLQ